MQISPTLVPYDKVAPAIKIAWQLYNVPQKEPNLSFRVTNIISMFDAISLQSEWTFSY